MRQKSGKPRSGRIVFAKRDAILGSAYLSGESFCEALDFMGQNNFEVVRRFRAGKMSGDGEEPVDLYNCDVLPELRR